VHKLVVKNVLMIMLEQISIDFAILSGNPFMLMGVDALSGCTPKIIAILLTF
jgi:hypothetical protein